MPTPVPKIAASEIHFFAALFLTLPQRAASHLGWGPGGRLCAPRVPDSRAASVYVIMLPLDENFAVKFPFVCGFIPNIHVFSSFFMALHVASCAESILLLPSGNPLTGAYGNFTAFCCPLGIPLQGHTAILRRFFVLCRSRSPQGRETHAPPAVCIRLAWAPTATCIQGREESTPLGEKWKRNIFEYKFQTGVGTEVGHP
jgi:hypothetical protein